MFGTFEGKKWKEKEEERDRFVTVIKFRFLKFSELSQTLFSKKTKTSAPSEFHNKFTILVVKIIITVVVYCENIVFHRVDNHE